MTGRSSADDGEDLTQPTTPPDGFDVVDSRVAYASRWTTVRVDTVAMPDGRTSEREIVEHLSAVGAVPLDGDGNVILLRQYRHAFGRRYLELPAGKLDVDGEDPAAAMQRELAEEIGMTAGSLRPLISYTNSAGWSTETTHVYLATELQDAPRPDDFELTHEEADMEVLRVPLAEAVQMVRDGRIVDSKTVIGLLAVAEQP